jgi:hypothetical protein
MVVSLSGAVHPAMTVARVFLPARLPVCGQPCLYNHRLLQLLHQGQYIFWRTLYRWCIVQCRSYQRLHARSLWLSMHAVFSDLQATAVLC